MSAHQVPVGALLIPEGAPFTSEKRGWLSGFLAAVLSAPPAASTDGTRATPARDPILANNDEAPWHDPAVPLADRMKLAEGKPLAPRLMAAMAQQDCGQCGYNCADYANALFTRDEERLNLCAPGGKQTQRMLKELVVELSAVPQTAVPAGDASPVDATTLPMAGAPAKQLGRCREQPVPAFPHARRLLSAPGSEKETWHIEIDLE